MPLMYCDQWQKSNNLTVNYYSEDIDILGRWGSNVAFLPQFVRAAGLARKNQGYRPKRVPISVAELLWLLVRTGPGGDPEL